jgi:hypothetical protein
MTEEGTSSDNDGAGGSPGIVRAGRIADIAGIEGPGLSKDRSGARGSAGIAKTGTLAGTAKAWASAIIKSSAGIAEFEGADGIAEAERGPVGAEVPASACIEESGYRARPGSCGAIFSISPLFSTSLMA